MPPKGPCSCAPTCRKMRYSRSIFLFADQSKQIARLAKAAGSAESWGLEKTRRDSNLQDGRGWPPGVHSAPSAWRCLCAPPVSETTLPWNILQRENSLNENGTTAATRDAILSTTLSTSRRPQNVALASRTLTLPGAVRWQWRYAAANGLPGWGCEGFNSWRICR